VKIKAVAVATIVDYLGGLALPDTPATGLPAALEPTAMLAAFRRDYHQCLRARADALFELTEHRRGHGALYDGLNSGRVDLARLRVTLAGLPPPRMADGRIVLAVDVSNWLRPDASASPDRLFCHVYGRAKGQAQMIPGWPYSFVAALESGRTSWTQILDAVRLGPADDATAVTATQLREVVNRLIAAGHWHPDDPRILIVADTGYDITRLAFVLADLPVQLLGRLRADRVLRLPKPPRHPDTPAPPADHPNTDPSSASMTRARGWPHSITPPPRRPATAPPKQPAGTDYTPD